MVRLRPVLRLARRVPDVADVLPLGPVRMAEPRAQGELVVPARPPAAAWSAARSRRRFADADCALPGLSRERGRSEPGRILAAVDGTAVLAVRAAVVPMAAVRPEHRRCGALSDRAWRRRPARTVG